MVISRQGSVVSVRSHISLKLSKAAETVEIESFDVMALSAGTRLGPSEILAECHDAGDFSMKAGLTGLIRS